MSASLAICTLSMLAASPFGMPGECRSAAPQEQVARGWALPTAQPKKPKPGAVRPGPAARVKPREPEAVRPAPPPSIASLNIDFGLGTAIMTDNGRRQADALFQMLQVRLRSERLFEVAGHTQRRGAAALNAELAQRRATAVVDYFVSRGLPRDAFQIKGVGGSEPLPGTDPDADVNRRVVITRID
jgi:outer membrane protein OmpA-like peptidoglycan-associated protein